MMEERLFFAVRMVLYVVTLTVFMVVPAAMSDGMSIVGIHGDASSYSDWKGDIIPVMSKVSPGSTVTWVNWVRGGQIKVLFKDGKKCKNVTADPQGYSLDSKTESYSTDYLPGGQKISLKFMEKGTYDFEVYAQGKIRPVKGQIVVQ